VKLAAALEVPVKELVKGITWQLPEKAESSVGSYKT
jgi:hypothetical protein